MYPDEASAKALLASAGLSVPPGRRAVTVDEAVAAAVRARLSGRAEGAGRRAQIGSRRG